MKILSGYIRKRFLNIFFYCLLAVLLIFIIVDLVEDIDRFIDRKVPTKIVILYYLYYMPYVVVLGTPVATLLATVFSVGSLAKNNEMIAMKALGYSLYKVLGVLLATGMVISAGAFLLEEGLAVSTNRRMENIKRNYLGRSKISMRLDHLEIQEPPNRIVTIGYYNARDSMAHRVKIEDFEAHQLVARIDAPTMEWEEGTWMIFRGIQRQFNGEQEEATAINEPVKMRFQFSPESLIRAQIKPDEMSMRELLRFVKRIRILGGEVYKWMTDFHLRISFPLSNFLIVLLSVPIAYNRRKRSIAVGFGLALLVVFLYFGIVKTGQTLGHKGGMEPMLAAWLGNIVMVSCGIMNVVFTRK